jgi:hypothetical protein
LGVVHCPLKEFDVGHIEEVASRLAGTSEKLAIDLDSGSSFTSFRIKRTEPGIRFVASSTTTGQCSSPYLELQDALLVLKELRDMVEWKDATARTLVDLCGVGRGYWSGHLALMQALVDGLGVVPTEAAVEAAVATRRSSILLFLLQRMPPAGFKTTMCVELAVHNLIVDLVGCGLARHLEATTHDSREVLNMLFAHPPVWALVDPSHIVFLAVRSRDVKVMKIVFGALQERGAAIPDSAQAIVDSITALRDKIETYCNLHLIGAYGTDDLGYGREPPSVHGLVVKDPLWGDGWGGE